MTDIGKNIKRILKEENMTQAELARRCGMPRSVISEIVNGKRKIVRLDTLDLIGKALNLMSPWCLAWTTVPHSVYAIKGEFLYLTEECCYDIVECNGHKIYQHPEVRDEHWMTFQEILDKCGCSNDGSYSIVANNILEGRVFSFGNHDHDLIHVVGYTNGYA